MKDAAMLIYAAHLLRLHRRWHRMAIRAYRNGYTYAAENAVRNAENVKAEIDQLLKRIPRMQKGMI